MSQVKMVFLETVIGCAVEIKISGVEDETRKTNLICFWSFCSKKPIILSLCSIARLSLPWRVPLRREQSQSSTTSRLLSLSANIDSIYIIYTRIYCPYLYFYNNVSAVHIPAHRIPGSHQALFNPSNLLGDANYALYLTDYYR